MPRGDRRRCGIRPPKKFSAGIIAVVSNRGLMWFRFHEGALNIETFIGFMKHLIKDAKRQVFFIVDNLGVHHAKEVRAWLAQHKDEIEVLYLPAYAPEHNPDEYLNTDLKQNLKEQARNTVRNSSLPRLLSSERSNASGSASNHIYMLNMSATPHDFKMSRMMVGN